jgi:FIST C domain
MDSLSAELTLQVIQYLNVRDSGRLAQQSRRCYYLVHQFRRLRGPVVGSAAVTADKFTTMGQLCRTAASQMQSKPQLAIAFHKNDRRARRRATDHHGWDKCLPKDTVVLGVYSNLEIQTIHCDPYHSTVECQNQSSIMMIGGIPPNSVEPFSFSPDDDDIDAFIRGLQEKNPRWKAFLLFVGGAYDGDIEQNFLRTLQSSFPNALIIGGCGTASSYVPVHADQLLNDAALRQRMRVPILDGYSELFSTRNRSFANRNRKDETLLGLCTEASRFFPLVEHSVCGVALSDAVPIQAIVSRGMKPYIRPALNIPSPIRVKSIDDSLGFPTIASLEDVDMGRELACQRLITEYGRRQYVGLRRESDDGFHVHHFQLFENRLKLDLMAGPTFVGAEVDLFDMTGDSLKDDVVQSMARLRDQTRGQKILGAIMVSCNGRGPDAGGIINEEMYDAKCFADAFPGVPCLGFYANGEIGPEARMGRTNLFRTGDAAVQAFTAVFGLFIVPDHVRLDTTTLHDSAEAISSFIHERLHHVPDIN